MEGSGTLCKSPASNSTTTSDGSSVKIKVLIYFNSEPTCLASDRTLKITVGELPRLIHLRKDISFAGFRKSIRKYAYGFSYYLPGRGLIVLETEADMENMLEEFDELNRKQGPQIFEVFGKWKQL